MTCLIIIKGTKVLTFGAGRDYINYRHARYCYWWAGPFYNSWSLTSLLRVSHWLATLIDNS